MLAGVAVLWLGGEVAACFGIGTSPTRLALISLRADPAAMLSLACAFLFFLCSGPSGREFAALGAVTLLLTGVLRLVSARVSPDVPFQLDAGCGFGAASLLLMGRRAWVSTGAERASMLTLLLPAILVFLFIPLTWDFHAIGIQVNPTTVDHLLYAADASLGGQLSFQVAQLFRDFPVVRELASFVYATLPVPFIAVLLMQWRSRRPSTGSIFWDFQVLAVLGFVVYLLYPAVGPSPIFSEKYFPDNPPAAADLLATWETNPNLWGGGWDETARNCVPSLHTAWALMLFWHARSLPGWVRGLTGYYLFFTLLATLGQGAHYLFDLILAVPFTLAIRAASRPSLPGTGRARWGAVLFGAGVTTALLLLIRFALPLLEWSVDLTRLSVFVVVVACLLWERKLDTLYQDTPTQTEGTTDSASLPRSQECLQTIPLTVE